MVDYLPLVLMMLHILFGAMWVGAILFLGLVVSPALKKAGPAVQGPAMGAIGPSALRYGPTMGALTILTGLGNLWLRQSLSIDGLTGTEWGRTILIVLVLALATEALGEFIVKPAAGAISDEMKKMKPGDKPTQRLMNAGATMEKMSRLGGAMVVLALLLMVYAGEAASRVSIA
jgi:uncharacterized membrane protein